jgi:hypothetical protein
MTRHDKTNGRSDAGHSSCTAITHAAEREGSPQAAVSSISIAVRIAAAVR